MLVQTDIACRHACRLAESLFAQTEVFLIQAKMMHLGVPFGLGFGVFQALILRGTTNAYIICRVLFREWCP